MAKQLGLFVQDSGGAGDALICLHGFLESSRMWEWLSLPANIRKIVIDLPGHGQSAHVEYTNIEELAEHVLTEVSALRVNKYRVIGHSMGGYVGLEMLRLDKRCTQLILLNSNTWSDDAQKQRDRQRVAALVMHSKKHFIYEAIPHLFWKPEEHSAIVEQLIQEAVEMKPEAIATAALAMSRRADLTAFAKENRSRISMIQGEHDAVVPIERVKELGLDEALDYAVISESAHMSLFEQNAQLEEVLNRILE